MYIVYVKTDACNRIVAVDSSAFLADPEGWIAIDRGEGDRFHHAQGNYFPQAFQTIGGACRYKLVDGLVEECTAEEIAEQEAANRSEPEPSVSEYEARIAALEEELAATKILLGVE